MKSKKVVYRYDNEDDKAKGSALEEFLFGSGAAVSKLLAKPKKQGADIANLVRQAEAEDSDEDDGLLFVEDRMGRQEEQQQQQDDDDDEAGPGPGSMRLQQHGAAGKGKKRRAAAWVDPADEGVTVQVASAPRLRKLRQSKGQTELSGADYEAALRRQHCALHPRTTWAMSAKQQRQSRGAPAAAGDAAIDEFEEPDEETAERLLMSGSGLLLGGGAAGGRGGVLAPGALELSRLRDANGASPSDAVVQALQFHPNGQLMLTAGFDKRLKLFQVDGLRNPLVQSLFLQDCPIHTAAFAAGGSKVVAAGRRPFYYIADLHTAQLERVVTPPSIHQQGQGSSTQQPLQQQRRKGGKGGKSSSGATGGRTGMKSCESFAASSDPARPLLAFLGDGGHIGLVNLGSRRPVGSLKMNGSARAAVFSSDGNTLITAGGDGVLYTWDLRSQRCMQQQRDEGAIDCTALTLSADSSYLATGGSSGVVNVYRRPAGLLSPVNLDDADVAGAMSSPAAAAGFGVQPAAPAPLKALMNLTTSIDSLSFSHDSQMLLMGSRLKKDSLRIVHLPSLTVFANWPTGRSPLQYVHSAAFSPHSGFLGIGNAKGRALLYRLHHYPEA